MHRMLYIFIAKNPTRRPKVLYLNSESQMSENSIIRIFIRTLGAAIKHNTNTMLKKKNTLKQ